MEPKHSGRIDKMRVLIVDNNVETREKTRSLLAQEKDLEVVGVARTGREAIDISQATEPDVVVLDVNTPDMDEIAVTEAICRRVPFAQIVILATQVEPNYMRRAMLAGARDFIVKPPMADELRSAVYRAGGLAQERRASSIRALPPSVFPSETTKPQSGVTGKIIMVYSPKGGTGATSIATNLAIGLQSPKTKTILVDGDLQYGDVAVFVNEVGFHSILDLTERIDDLDPDVIASVLAQHAPSGVDVMVAPNRPELADKVSGEEYYKVLQYLRTLYAYIVVDTSSALSEITLSIMDAADLIVLVTTQEIPAIKNTRLFLSITDGLHLSRDRIMLALNQYDRQVALSPEKIGENLHQDVVCVIPMDHRNALRAENQGRPFILEHREEALAKAVQELASRVSKRLEELATTDTPALRAIRQAF